MDGGRSAIFWSYRKPVLFFGAGMMKKGRLAETIIVFAIFCLSTPIFAAIPRLHVDGNKIKDPNGNVVILRGIDMMDLGVTQDWYGGATAMIDRITNKNDTQSYSPGWYPKVARIDITPPDSVNYSWPHPFDPNNTDLYNLLRTVVNYYAAKDMYAIIDWHYIAHTSDHVASTSAFWTYMAPRFANDAHVMFELFNEPNDEGASDTDIWLTVRANMQTWVNIVRTYAPNTVILVGGPNYSSTLAPQVTYPIDDNNIIYVAHIYPAHWLSIYGSQDYFKSQMITCAAVYPVMMTEWGFTTTSETLLNGTVSNYGQPLMDFREQYGISNSAWVVSYDWGPPMFNTNWTLRTGEGEMGGFVKDELYAMKDSNQPGGSSNILPTISITSPSTGDVFASGSDITIAANASDSDGFVTKVEFFAGYTKIGEDAVAPYSCTWHNPTMGRYSLTARATDNNTGVKISPAVSISIASGEATGFILREWWTGISGTSVSDLTSDINYPNNPNSRNLITKLEGPTYWSNADNEGTRISGYVYPPADGNYTFWIASDDSSQLLLSTDADPCHATQIASVSGWTGQYEWTKYPSQTSSPKALLAGHKYYIEALHKQGGGGNLVAVAWQGPGITQQVIDGLYLSPYLYKFNDYATFASQWLKTNCSRSNAWCSGADRDRDGNVGLDDLMTFAQWWLLETN
jgi:hypothetical protein